MDEARADQVDPFNGALDALKAASELPGDTRSQRRERDLRVKLAELDLDKAAAEERNRAETDCVQAKAHIRETVAEAKRKARAASK